MNNKDLHIVTYMYIPANINRLELWLKNKASEGYRLVKMSGWRFWFEKSKAREREYFICHNFDNGKGIEYDFLMAKKKYGIKKTMLWENAAIFFEANPQRTDDEYLRTKRLRNHYYQKHYLGLSIFLAVLLLISICLVFYKINIIISLLLIFPMFLYSLISLLIITNYLRNNN